jgi:hypothetical protein
MDDDEKLLETLKQRARRLPTGEGKKHSPRSGEVNKLHKRAEVLQAAGAQQNTGTAEQELDLQAAISKSEESQDRALEEQRIWFVLL